MLSCPVDLRKSQRYEYFDPVQGKFFHSWYDDEDVKYVVNWSVLTHVWFARALAGVCRGRA